MKRWQVKVSNLKGLLVKLIPVNGQGTRLHEPTVSDILAPGNQTDINAGSKRDTSSSGIFLIGTENARLHTSDCVAPTSINLIDLEPRWAPPELPPPCCWTEVDQSYAGGHNSITTQCQRLLFTTWNEYTHRCCSVYSLLIYGHFCVWRWFKSFNKC